jgi:hypothetical protein
VSSKKANRVVKMACKFWLSRRPVGWTTEQHLENPTINSEGSEATKNLFDAIGEMIRCHHNPEELLD